VRVLRIILACGCGHTATFEAGSMLDTHLLDRWSWEWKQEHEKCAGKQTGQQPGEGTKEEP
jgi:hypothetical protein